MRFGLWYDFRNPPNSGRSTQQLDRETLDQIVYAEELGYDDIWLSEHHFIADGYLPSCLPVAGAIARCTELISIGTSILLLPFHHPIRLAEDAAVVDLMSDGRFILGVAVGYRLEEFATFGVERRHRGSITEEAIEVLRRCWTEDEFSHHGRHFHYDAVRCTPKPVQQPIPIFVGAVQGEAVRRAARLGDGLLSAGARTRRWYGEALAASDKTPNDADIVAAGRFLFCSEEPARDWEMLKEHALYQLQNYAAWFKAAGQPAFGHPPVDFADLESRRVYLCGRPDEIVTTIRAEHELAPFTRHNFWAVWPGVDPSMATRSIELFAHEVIPQLRHL